MKAKKQWAVGLVLLVSAGLLVWFNHHNLKPAPPISSQPAKPPAPPPDPLTIAAIKARNYPGSPITLIRNIGEQGGYRSQVVSYQSDGLTIYALLATPDGSPPDGGWPVVILDHGYINPAQYQTNGSSYRSWIAALARGGFLVIKPDYRGHGLSQGQAVGGHFAPDYTYDVLNLVASVKQYPSANAKRIGVMGHSMGGHVSLNAAVVSKDIKATVLAAGVVGSFEDIFYNWPHSPIPGDQPQAVVQATIQKEVNDHGDPKANPDFWNSASAINYVQDLSGPVQVDHGTADPVVPKLFSDHLVQALQQKNKPVEYNVYPGADHNLYPDTNQMLAAAVAFFKKNL